MGPAIDWRRWQGDGPPILLVHGAGANAAVWEPLARELSGFEVFAPSLPGRCGSEGDAPERASDAAAWLEDAMAALDLRAIVLGHSYGGAVAIELALRAARVLGLVLVASGARLRVHPGVLAMAEEAVRTEAPMPIDFAFSDGAPRAAIERYAEAAARTPPVATRADWRACDAFDRMDAIGAIDRPALVATGASDALTPPKYQRFLAERLPRAQLELVAGAGHMLPWERPRELARVIRAWVSAVS